MVDRELGVTRKTLEAGHRRYNVGDPVTVKKNHKEFPGFKGKVTEILTTHWDYVVQLEAKDGTVAKAPTFRDDELD